MKSNILLIEDNEETQNLIRRVLSKHHLVTTTNPDEVVQILDREKIDLILLDLGLPGRDGFTVLDELQASRFSSIPIVCITGKTEISDKVAAFTMGADDYIIKPFDIIEFKARIDAKIARIKKHTVEQNFTVGKLRVNWMSQQIFSEANVEIPLTQTEYKILICFIHDSTKVFSRQELMNAVWGNEETVFDRAVDVHISSLRRKLMNHGIRFKSVPGVGYRFLVDDEVRGISPDF